MKRKNHEYVSFVEYISTDGFVKRGIDFFKKTQSFFSGKKAETHERN